MPWIQVTYSTAGNRVVDPVRLGGALASRASAALGLTEADVIVLPVASVGASGSGAVVAVTGGLRSPTHEAELRTAVASATAEELGLDPALVAYVRTPTTST